MKASLVAIIAVAACLSACGNSPQQPTDVVDDQSAQSPYGDETDQVAEMNPEVSAPEDEVFETPADTSEVDTGTTTASVTSAASSIAAMTGRWAPTAVDCDVADAVFDISATRFERGGRACEVAELIGAGEGSITAALQCESGTEDAGSRELLRLSRVGDELSYNLVGSEDLPATLVRCSP